MTDKFEQMLERLINEDRAGAEELFHEIVVEKSRNIYQDIIESDEDEDLDETEDDDLDENEDDDLDETDDDDLDESDDDEEVNESEEDEDLDEMFGLEAPEEDPMAAMGGDATDDMMGDVGMDGEEEPDMDSEGGDGIDGAIDNLGDALEQLKAEFEAMIGGADTSDDDEEGDDDMGGFPGADDDEEEEEPEEEAYAFESDDDADEEEVKETSKVRKSDGEQMREYVEKVGGDRYTAYGKMGDNGTNTKSTVASKNDMGGTTSNILKAGSEKPTEANKGHLKGQSVFKGTPKTDNAGNINVPGGKAGKSSFKKSEPGHGAEKKGKPETADKSAGSTIKTTVRKK
jgi:hypothetical protein